MDRNWIDDLGELCREDVKRIYFASENFWNDNSDEVEVSLLSIAKEFGKDPVDVKRWYNAVGSVSSPSKMATLFYNENKYLKGEPCFGFRNTWEMIPLGSVCFGTIISGQGFLGLSPEVKTVGQAQDLSKVITEALVSVGSPQITGVRALYGVPEEIERYEK